MNLLQECQIPKIIVLPEFIFYSNAGYSVLGRTLERVAKESYDDWVMENIIKPLGMKNTGFDLLGK